MENGESGCSSNGDAIDGSNGCSLNCKKVSGASVYPARDGHCGCSIGEKVFIFGGVVSQNRGNEHRETNDLLAFNTVDMKWEKIVGSGCTPVPRVSAAIASVGSRLYLFGGLSNSVGWLNDFYVFDTETKVWSKPETAGNAPSPRDKLAAAVCGSKIYYFGGFGPKAARPGIDDDNDDEEMSSEEDEDVNAVRAQQKAAQFGWFDDIFVYDTDTSSWSQPMHMNACTLTARAAHTMCGVGDKLVIFGGRDSESRTNDIHFYDTTSRKWTAGPQAPRQLEPRSFHAACAIGTRVFIVGGRGTQDQHFNDCHVFDTGSGKWLQSKLVGDALPALGSHSVVAVGSTIYLYGGSSDFNRNVGHCTKYYSDLYAIHTAS